MDVLLSPCCNRVGDSFIIVTFRLKVEAQDELGLQRGRRCLHHCNMTTMPPNIAVTLELQRGRRFLHHCNKAEALRMLIRELQQGRRCLHHCNLFMNLKLSGATLLQRGRRCLHHCNFSAQVEEDSELVLQRGRRCLHHCNHRGTPANWSLQWSQRGRRCLHHCNASTHTLAVRSSRGCNEVGDVFTIVTQSRHSSRTRYQLQRGRRFLHHCNATRSACPRRRRAVAAG